MLRALCFVLAIGFAAEPAPAQAPALAPLDPVELSRRAAESFAGARTWYEGVLSVSKRRGSTPSQVTFRVWQERASGRAFLRVLAPSAEAGTGYLRLPPVLWRYQPRTASIESLGPEQLAEPWQGSGFTLADVLGPPAGLGGGAAQRVGVESDTDAAVAGASVLELRGAAGSARLWLSAGGSTPLRAERRAADGSLATSFVFDDLRVVQGRSVPHRWTATSAGRESRIEIAEIRFDPVFDDAIFTTRQLLQRAGTPAAPQPSDARLAAPGGSPP